MEKSDSFSFVNLFQKIEEFISGLKTSQNCMLQLDFNLFHFAKCFWSSSERPGKYCHPLYIINSNIYVTKKFIC